ncbi:MAG: AMP-binding protein, partial [Gimesia sp.]|nr:AMP-binding protein [Gimesia sp.]
MDIPADMLVDCGLLSDEAQKFSDILKEIHVQDDAELWKQLIAQVLTPELPFSIHRLLYQRVFHQRMEQGKPAPAWFPGEQEQSDSHLSEWLRDLNLNGMEELQDWSIQNREAFTQKLVDSLKIPFLEQPQQIMNLDTGVEQIEWLTGAKLNIVESCFKKKSDQTAIIFQQGSQKLQKLSYQELKALTAQVANGLQEAGIKPGERIAVMMPMTPESVAIFLGIIAAGCVVVTIADSFSAEEMQVRLKITEPKLIFIQDVISRNNKQLPLYTKLESDSKLPAIVLPESETSQIPLRSGDRLWSEFLSDHHELTYAARKPHDETTILFSSGTTGNPKGIPWDQTTPIKSAGDG